MRAIKSWTTYIAVTLYAVSVSGCSFFSDPEYVKIEQCRTASKHLDRIFNITNKAAEWRLSQIDQPTDREGVLELRKVIAAGLADQLKSDGTIDTDKLIEWNESKYCAQLIESYQVSQYNTINQEINLENTTPTERAIIRATNQYNANIDSNEKAECRDFIDHTSLLYEKPITASVQITITDSLKKAVTNSYSDLEAHKIELILRTFSNDNSAQLLQEIANECSHHRYLAQAISSTPSIRHAQSDAIIYLSSILEEIKATPRSVGCGEVPEVYCEIDIKQKSITQAIEIQRKCELEQSKSETCNLDREALLKELVFMNEHDLLQSKISDYKGYIRDPFGSRTFRTDNLQAKIDSIAEHCLRKAISSRIKGDRYLRHKNEVCIPSAIDEVTRPQQITLEKLENRLNNLISSYNGNPSQEGGLTQPPR